MAKSAKKKNGQEDTATDRGISETTGEPKQAWEDEESADLEPDESEKPESDQKK